MTRQAFRELYHQKRKKKKDHNDGEGMRGGRKGSCWVSSRFKSAHFPGCEGGLCWNTTAAPRRRDARQEPFSQSSIIDYGLIAHQSCHVHPCRVSRVLHKVSVRTYRRPNEGTK